MSNLFFECIDLDCHAVRKAFDDVLSWLDELNMKSAGDSMCEEIADVFSKENPFTPFIDNTERYLDKVFSSATNKMIYLIFVEASNKIREKYPDAKISYVANGDMSIFTVDDETYEKAHNEWCDADE